MNTQAWIHHFAQNTRINAELVLPDQPITLPAETRRQLAASLAVFQLGESGSGSRLRRYAREVAPLENFRGYQRAIDLFIAEEQGHAELLARAVRHLGGTLLEKQWTNSVFRRLRFLVNLEFAIQVLVTAELIAEVYYGTLFLHARDDLIRVMSQKILRDEMKHLAFQREFLAERLASFSGLSRWLWWQQFDWVHRITTTVVAWDHRRCLRQLGVSQAAFRQRAARSRQRFSAKLMAMVASDPLPARRESASSASCEKING